MWKCPVCDQENNAATVCPACGSDRTCDYEQYPTAFAVTAAKPTHTLRREWREMQSSLAESAPQPARQAETQPVTVFLTLAEAAAGCRKTVSLRSGKNRVRLALPIPAGVLYGEKLRYSLFNRSNGTWRYVTIKIRLYRFKILWNLFLHLAALATIAMGLSLCALILSLVIGIFGGSFISPADALKMFLGSAACYAVFGGPILICESVYKKKYGPKTLAESVRCEVSRVIPPILSDHI